MIYDIPLFSDKTSRWTSEVDLSNKRYKIYLSWNERGKFWEFSIFDTNENLLAGGIKLVKRIDLIEEFRNYVVGLPKGQLQLVPRDNVVEEITRDNLYTSFALVYIDEE